MDDKSTAEERRRQLASQGIDETTIAREEHRRALFREALKSAPNAAQKFRLIIAYLGGEPPSEQEAAAALSPEVSRLIGGMK